MVQCNHETTLCNRNSSVSFSLIFGKGICHVLFLENNFSINTKNQIFPPKTVIFIAQSVIFRFPTLKKILKFLKGMVIERFFKID